jgi:hypothetical protein
MAANLDFKQPYIIFFQKLLNLDQSSKIHFILTLWFFYRYAWNFHNFVKMNREHLIIISLSSKLDEFKG